MNVKVENTNILPDGSLLTKDENIISSKKLPSWILTFYIKATLLLTNKRVVAHFPKIFLWILPLWFENLNINLKQISTVKVDKQFSFWKMLLGLVLIIWWLPTIILPIIWIILLFPNVYIAIYNTWGQVTYIPVVFWQNKLALEFAWTLNNTIIENN